MADRVAICNQALGSLGASLITALEDASTEAQLCAAHYETIRDAVLEARNWSFALQRLGPLAPANPGPTWGAGKRYHLPAEVLRVVRCDDGTESGDLEWVREGRHVIADVGALYLLAVVRVEDEAEFSSLFTQALVARLAAELAVPLTENRSRAADLWAIYDQKLREASVRDSQQGTPQKIQFNKIRRSRY